LKNQNKDNKRPKHAKITQKSLRRRIVDLVRVSRDILSLPVALDAKRDLRPVGDVMVIDLLRVVACSWHMTTRGEPRQLPRGVVG
jgi:hypothetical protein